MSISLKSLIVESPTDVNGIFAANLLCESNYVKREDQAFHAYLTECLTYGDEFMFEVFGNKEVKSLILEAQQPPPIPQQDINSQVLQILAKYGHQKSQIAQELPKAAAATKDKQTQAAAQSVAQNIMATQGKGSAVSNAVISIITNGLAKMGNKVEGAATKAGQMIKDPKQAQDALNKAIQKIKPVLKGEDGKYITDIQKLVQQNPGWANIAVGVLINFSKMASIGMAGASGGTSVAVGAIVGMGLRTLVGRMKGEDWKTAAKKAVKVTAISLLSGAALKGIIGMFRGDGFFSGFKSYFGFGGNHPPSAEAQQQAQSERAVDSSNAPSGRPKLTLDSGGEKFTSMVDRHGTIDDALKNVNRGAGGLGDLDNEEIMKVNLSAISAGADPQFQNLTKFFEGPNGYNMTLRLADAMRQVNPADRLQLYHVLNKDPSGVIKLIAKFNPDDVLEAKKQLMDTFGYTPEALDKLGGASWSGFLSLQQPGAFAQYVQQNVKGVSPQLLQKLSQANPQALQLNDPNWSNWLQDVVSKYKGDPKGFEQYIGKTWVARALGLAGAPEEPNI